MCGKYVKFNLKFQNIKIMKQNNTMQAIICNSFKATCKSYSRFINVVQGVPRIRLNVVNVLSSRTFPVEVFIVL